jgi:hypothetical protein
MEKIITYIAIFYAIVLILFILGKGIVWLDNEVVEKRQVCIQNTDNVMYCYERYR